MRALLIVPLAALVALEIYHCARRNGRRFTATFFAGAFVFGVIRANIVGLVNWFGDAGPPYAIVGPTIRLGFSTLVEPAGWAFALYGSWFLAEGMIRHGARRQPDVFSVSFLACFVMAGFAYAVEAAATPTEWWHWVIAIAGSPYVYAVPMVGIFDWATVSVDYLFPFLLSQCSPARGRRWTLALFGLVIVHHLGAHLYAVRLGPYLQLFDAWHWVTIWALGAAALVKPLPITAPCGRERPAALWALAGERRGLDVLPFVSVGGMLAVVLYAVLGESGDLRLLWSVTPLAAAMAAAAPGAPAWAVLAAFAVALWRSWYAAPAVLQTALVVIHGGLARMRPAGARRAAAVALAAAGLAAYLPWASAMTARTNRFVENVQAGARAEGRGDYGSAIGHYREAYANVSEFAGGERVLTAMLRTAWLERDRETFDWAARELRGFGPRFAGASELWNVSDAGEIDERLLRMKAKRPSGLPGQRPATQGAGEQ
jgi:hypothetical protein